MAVVDVAYPDRPLPDHPLLAVAVDAVLAVATANVVEPHKVQPRIRRKVSRLMLKFQPILFNQSFIRIPVRIRFRRFV